MAIIGTLFPTYIDVAKRLDPKGKIDVIVELLRMTNPILNDMVVKEGNLPTGHRTTVRTGLPDSAWRLLNYGVPSSKSTTAQVTDACGMLESYAEVDKALADLNGNTSEFRFSEDKAFIQSMNNNMATTLFYGDTSADPAKFVGLAPRFNLSTAPNGENIIKGGGSGSDNTSVWLVVWGPDTIHAIYPKGSQGGFQHRDLGEHTLIDAAGGKYQGYRTHYKWDLGLTVRDWQYVVRICNIDVSDLTKTGSSGADLVDLMVQALEIPPTLSMGRAAFYCNRTVKGFLRRQIMNKSNVNLSLETVAGQEVLRVGGVTVNRSDALLSTEATVA